MRLGMKEEREGKESGVVREKSEVGGRDDKVSHMSRQVAEEKTL